MTYYIISVTIFVAALMLSLGIFRGISQRSTSTNRHKNALRMKFAGALLVAASISLFLALSGWMQIHPGFYDPRQFPDAPFMKYVAGLVAALFVGIVMIMRGHRVAVIEERLRRQRIGRIRDQRRRDSRRHLRVIAS